MRSLLVSILFLFPLSVFSQSGYQYFDIAVGSGFDYFTGEISIDFYKRYHKAVEVFFDTYQQHSVIEGQKESYQNYKLGLAYKPVLVRGKNQALNWRFSASLGSDSKEVIAGLGAGFEYNIATRNLIYMFRQKNEIVLWGKDHFRSSLLIGIKIPL